jgi:glycolate oxidase FAD binding subunit
LTTSYAYELSRIVPEGALPPSYVHSEYAIDGLSPMAVVVPEDRDQVADVMRWAGESGVTVFPRGGGTKTALGNPPDSVSLVLDLSRLNRVIDYQPGDMTVTVEAGITLDALQRELAAARQFVPLESPLPGRATVGGTLATAYSGPMAHAYGPPRDWLIGVGVVGADGVATKAGGRVVKNVTGYDLNKLYTGSMGTLGIIVEASFKVSPLQPEDYALVALFDTMEEAIQAGWEALNLPSGPMSYLAVTGGLARHFLSTHPGSPLGQAMGERMGGLGLCFFSGRAGAVKRRVEDTSAALLNAGAIDALTVEGEGPRAARQWAVDLGWQEATQPVLALRLTAPRRTIPNLAETCLRIGLLETPSEILADPGFGAVRVLFWGESDDEGIMCAVNDVRQAARQHGASVVIEVCHPSLKVNLDVWGAEPGSMELFRRIKEQLDPQRLLNRGRFVGRL